MVLRSETNSMPKPLFEQGFAAALAHVNAGNLAAAVAICSQLRQARPTDPAVAQLDATIELRMGRPNDALVSIRRSLAMRPTHVPSLILAGRAALAAGLPDQAVAPLREAIARAPGLAEPAFLLCRTLLSLRDTSLDVTLDLTAQRHPGQPFEWQQLGLALQRAGKSDAALTAFTRAAAADPTLAAARFGRGLLLRDTGRMTEARTALQQAVALDPTASGAWFALGLTCQDLLDESGAATAFEAALRERPDFAEAAVNLGIALQRLGDMQAAMAAYRSAIAIRPDTFGRIAQAVTAARTGMLWLDPAAFRRALGV
jgi:tetratricopeptide (TPR) repeat protein